MMTAEELNKIISEAVSKRVNEINRIEKEFKDTRSKALKQWATDNARFQIGDIIEYPGNNCRIKIEKMSADFQYCTNIPYVVYYGPQLTQKLEPIKNGNPMFGMYDDGRSIEKIK